MLIMVLGMQEFKKRNEHRRKTGQDTTESTSDTTVSEADLTRHKS